MIKSIDRIIKLSKKENLGAEIDYFIKSHTEKIFLDLSEKYISKSNRYDYNLSFIFNDVSPPISTNNVKEFHEIPIREEEFIRLYITSEFRFNYFEDTIKCSGEFDTETGKIYIIEHGPPLYKIEQIISWKNLYESVIYHETMHFIEYFILKKYYETDYIDYDEIKNEVSKINKDLTNDKIEEILYVSDPSEIEPILLSFNIHALRGNFEAFKNAMKTYLPVIITMDKVNPYNMDKRKIHKMKRTYINGIKNEISNFKNPFFRKELFNIFNEIISNRQNMITGEI